MIAITAVKELHQELQRLLPDSLVILGGSYATETATVESDVDLYVVASWVGLWHFWQRRKELRDWKNRHCKEIEINIVLVPLFFYHRGWYGVKGIDATSKQCVNGRNDKMFARNALKLSGFFYLKSLQSADTKHQQFYQQKACKQLNFANASVAVCAREGFKDVWQKAKQTNEKYLGFSWANWFIYNLRFLPKGEFSFLFCNPDQVVIKILEKAIMEDDFSAETYFALDRIVFPVYLI